MPTTVSTARLEARISANLHAMLKRAAELQGRTMTDFVVSAVQDAAVDQAVVLRAIRGPKVRVGVRAIVAAVEQRQAACWYADHFSALGGQVGIRQHIGFLREGCVRGAGEGNVSIRARPCP